jgi:Tol biopolymer transport system component
MRIRLALCALVPALVLPAAAHAAFPGANGRIAFANRATGCIESVNPDGTGRRGETPCGSRDEQLPAWSPEGVRLAYEPYASGIEYVTNRADPRTVVPGDFLTDKAHWAFDGERFVSSSFGCVAAGDCEGRVFTVRADGSDYRVVAQAHVIYPYRDTSWSPDGRWITFSTTSNGFFYKVHPDGTGQMQVLTDVHNPDWSPDGSKIAFDRAGDIWSVNADGTGAARVTNNPAHRDSLPAWSPDGKKIAFTSERNEPSPGSCAPNCNYETYVATADGGAPTNVTNTPTVGETAPDWQPVPTGYARPKGARPLRVSLVPSYQQCAAPNRTHGAPLAFPSCRFPRQSYPFVTVGTGDANGAEANSVGFVQLDVKPGTPGPPDDAHVYIAAKVSDVRCGAAVDPPPPGSVGLCDSANATGFPDYGGALQVRLPIRITDTLNAPDPAGTGPGTMTDYELAVPLPCATTASTDVGSTCITATEAGAVVPGIVPEGKRAIWQLGQVEVHAADSSAPPDALFETQGVFVP